jgi:hypothetical protein
MVMRANVMQAVHDDADGLRAWLCEPGIEDLWKAAFLARLRQGQRDAVRLYAEARKLVNSPADVAGLVLAAIGAQPAFARGAVEIVRDAEGMDAHATARLAMQTAIAYCSREGITLAQLAERASGAEVMEEVSTVRHNGNGNGNGGHS